MGKMLPIKIILEISCAGTNQEGRLLVRAGSGICVADDTVAVSPCLGWDKPSPGQGCAASTQVN